MPGMTPLRPDDVHSARAWAAFVADDAAAARAAVARGARACGPRARRWRRSSGTTPSSRRRQWFAGCTALAASLLAAAAWSLAPHAPTTPASPTGTTPESRRERPADVDAIAATTPEPSASVTPESDDAGPADADDQRRGRPRPGHAAARAGWRPVRCSIRPTASARLPRPVALRAKSFAAPTVEPTFTKGRPTHAIAAPGAPALAAAPPMPARSRPTAVGPHPRCGRRAASTASSIPDAAETAPRRRCIRLDQATPAPMRRARIRRPRRNESGLSSGTSRR